MVFLKGRLANIDSEKFYLRSDSQMTSPTIRRYSKEKEYFFFEGCYINELSNDSSDSDVSIAQARVCPGVTTKWHRLNATTERYVILEGEGLVELGDNQAEIVSAGDIVIIPPLTPQRITNNSDSDLIFLAICSQDLMRLIISWLINKEYHLTEDNFVIVKL